MRFSHLTCVALLPFIAACGSMSKDKPGAIATLAPTQNQTAEGDAAFRQRTDGVEVHIRMVGLKPNSEHAFHVHEKGDCKSPDGSSAGPHFNPTGKPHGPQHADHHAGDLPNLKADGNGSVDTKFVVQGITLKDGATAIVGRGLIVHAQPDDYKSQPAGNAGGRISCGVIVAGS